MSGLSTVCVSTKIRARDSYRSGISQTMHPPTNATAQATLTAAHRYRQTPRATIAACLVNSFIPAIPKKSMRRIEPPHTKYRIATPVHLAGPLDHVNDHMTTRNQNQLCGTIMISPGLTSTLADMSPRLSRSFRRTLYCLPDSDPRTSTAPLPSAKSVSPPA